MHLYNSITNRYVITIKYSWLKLHLSSLYCYYYSWMSIDVSALSNMTSRASCLRLKYNRKKQAPVSVELFVRIYVLWISKLNDTGVKVMSLLRDIKKANMALWCVPHLVRNNNKELQLHWSGYARESACTWVRVWQVAAVRRKISHCTMVGHRAPEAVYWTDKTRVTPVSVQTGRAVSSPSCCCRQERKQ